MIYVVYIWCVFARANENTVFLCTCVSLPKVFLWPCSGQTEAAGGSSRSSITSDGQELGEKCPSFSSQWENSNTCSTRSFSGSPEGLSPGVHSGNWLMIPPFYWLFFLPTSSLCHLDSQITHSHPILRVYSWGNSHQDKTS